MSKFKPLWPAWFFGPNGQEQIFNSEAEVPSGWVDHPSKLGGKQPPKPPAPAPTPNPTPTPPATPPAGDADLDAHGHPWSDKLHASSKSKTTQGLWRMKVGVSRPDPAPGYPKPAAPLDL